MTGMARIEAAILASLRGLLGLGLVALVLLNVVNAAGRYGGLPTLTGADELMVYGMIWIVMVGAILATRERSHLSIDVLPGRLSRQSARLLSVATGLAGALVAAFVSVQSWSFIGRIGALGQTSMGLGIPMTIPHLAVFTGFAGMAIVSAALVLSDLRALAAGAGE